MSEIVTCYGLHDANGVKYLHQGRSKAANFISLGQASPFEVMTQGGRKVACPHLINPCTPMPDKVQWALFLEMYTDPLVKYFLPIPRLMTELIPYIGDANNELLMHLVLLSRLSSPIYPVVHQFKTIRGQRIREELSLTNVAPLVVAGLTTEDQPVIEQLAREARRAPRRLILVGDPMVIVREPMERVVTGIRHFDEVTLHSAPMESLGAVALRRYARGEQINGLWIRKEEE